MPKESTIQVFRSNTTPFPAGLTFGELAFTDVGGSQRLFVGTNNGVTGSVWIGASITGASAAISAGLTDHVPTLRAVKEYVDGIVVGGTVVNTLNGSAGAITITGSGAVLFSQVAGANTIGARLASTSVTGVASFNATRFTVSGGGEVDLATGFQVTGDTVVAGTAITATRSGNTVTVNNNGVVSVNGSTGAITNIAVLGANTFTGLQTMNSGVTANHLYVSQGATFASRASFLAGITGSGFVAGFTGYHGASAGSLLRIQAGPPSGVVQAGIQIDGTGGGDITFTSNTNAISLKPTVTIAGGSPASIRMETGDGDTQNFNSTLTTGIITGNRVYTLPDITGTLAVANATQSFTARQNFTAGLSANHLWVAQGATFGGVGINVSAGGISVTGGIAGSITTPAQGNITSVGSLTTLTSAGLTATQRVTVNSGGILVNAGGLSVTGGASITGGAVISGGGISVTGGIAGSIVTPAQTSITSLGSLTTLTSAGLTSTERVTITGGAVINGGGLSVTGGANLTGGATIAGPFTVLGGIPNAQLQNSSVSIVGGASSTLSLGGTLTLTGVANSVVVSNNGTNTLTLSLANDIVIPGNLTVNGSVVTANVDSFVVEDPLFMLGTGNANDTVDLGFYAQYMDASNTGRRFTGLFRDASDKKYYLFSGLTGTQEPGTTVNLAGEGFTAATLVARIDGGTF